jgi:Uma2 family endonuclease
MIHVPVVATMFGDGDLLERPGSAQSMVMPDTARRYTIDEVLAFPPDGNRYELVDGELVVTPAPRAGHQLVVGEFHALLREYLRACAPRLRVVLAPADIRWPGEVLVQPDVFVVPVEQLAAEDWSDVRTLVLAVEVVSPSSARHDRVTKRRVYQRQRVPTYWAADRDARLVEVWRPGDERPEVVTDVLRWRVAPDAPVLEIVLEQVFAAAS